MPETIIEETIEVLPKEYLIKLDGVATIAVFSLAAYGAQDLARKTAAKSKQIWTNRKAKKASKKAEPTPQQ